MSDLVFRRRPSTRPVFRGDPRPERSTVRQFGADEGTRYRLLTGGDGECQLHYLQNKSTGVKTKLVSDREVELAKMLLTAEDDMERTILDMLRRLKEARS